MWISTIIVAGGKGRRFGQKKQFYPLLGKPVILWTINAFKPFSDEIILVLPGEDIGHFRKNWPEESACVKLAAGGKERSDSVANGLKQLSEKCDMVCIHDGARPLIEARIIRKCIHEAARHGSAICAVPSTDTVKLSGRNCFIEKTIDRNRVWLVQTPQVFKKEIITSAYKKHGRRKATDDAGLVEMAGRKIKLVMGDYSNIKITQREDILTAENYLKYRRKK